MTKATKTNPIAIAAAALSTNKDITPGQQLVVAAITKDKTKPVTNVAQFPARTLVAGLKAFNDSVLAEVKASGGVASALTSIGLYLLATHGVSVCTERSSSAAKSFTVAWDDNYAKLVEKAPAGSKDTLANQKGVYKGRALRFAAQAAIAQGKSMTPDQREAADKLIAKYDSNKSRKKGKIESRSYKARMTDELSSLYKFHMKSEADRGGVSQPKWEVIGRNLGESLKLLGVDLSILNENA